MYYPFSENKGTDQLPGYREADLCLCFRKCRLFVFSRVAQIKYYKPIYMYMYFSVHYFRDFFSSPEPLGSQGELIGWP